MTATFIPRPDLIQVTYRYLSDKLIDPEKKAKALVLGQTTDTWTPTGLSGSQKLRKHSGTVLGIDERTHELGKPYEYYLTVGFPPANTEDDIPSLLTMIFGKISMDGKIRLDSIHFPQEYLKGKGPKHGIAGIRKLVSEPEKPLAMAIFKPGFGLSPTELGKMFFELALGGLHLVKDDEILPDLALCPVEKRLAACLEAGEKARLQTERPTLYAVNLTGRPSQMLSKAKRLARHGAQCFLINVLSYGFGVLEELRSLGIPLMAHPALAGAIAASPDTGIAYPVLLGALMRLGGADIVLFPSSFGTVALPESESVGISNALTRGMQPLAPSFPAPSAGIHPGLVPKILKAYGPDVIINAGGGIHGHPMGAAAGARALRQAINWSVRNRDFSSLPVREFPELAKALTLWGRR